MPRECYTSKTRAPVRRPCRKSPTANPRPLPAPALCISTRTGSCRYPRPSPKRSEKGACLQHQGPWGIVEGAIPFAIKTIRQWYARRLGTVPTSTVSIGQSRPSNGHLRPRALNRNQANLQVSVWVFQRRMRDKPVWARLHCCPSPRTRLQTAVVQIVAVASTAHPILQGPSRYVSRQLRPGLRGR
jgi:hypothetical protein